MVQGFLDWLEQPYRENMTAFQWIALIFLILFALTLWGWLMSRISD